MLSTKRRHIRGKEGLQNGDSYVNCKTATSSLQNGDITHAKRRHRIRVAESEKKGITVRDAFGVAICAPVIGFPWRGRWKQKRTKAGS